MRRPSYPPGRRPLLQPRAIADIAACRPALSPARGVGQVHTRGRPAGRSSLRARLGAGGGGGGAAPRDRPQRVDGGVRGNAGGLAGGLRPQATHPSRVGADRPCRRPAAAPTDPADAAPGAGVVRVQSGCSAHPRHAVSGGCQRFVGGGCNGSQTAAASQKRLVQARGAYRNRTGVNGFAGRCVTTPPRRRVCLIMA
jgi:hypothetical protein